MNNVNSDDIYDFMPGEIRNDDSFTGRNHRKILAVRRLKKTASDPVDGLPQDFDQPIVQVMNSLTDKLRSKYAADDMIANLSLTSKKEAHNLPYAPQQIRVAVSVTSARTNKPVHHKDEGARFTGLSDQVHSTIKLVNNKMYVLSVTIVPPVKLSMTSQTEECSTFKGFWTCRTIRNKDKQRNIITLGMRVADFGTVTMPVMAKTYEKLDFGIRQGQPLKYVVYDFHKDARYDREPELKSIEHYSDMPNVKDQDILTNEAIKKSNRFTDDIDD